MKRILKRILVGLFLALPGLFLALLFTRIVWSQKPSERRYLLVYTVMVRDLHRQHLMVCDTPGCNDVYDSEERHEWFETTEAALSWINLTPISGELANGNFWGTRPALVNFVGLYEVRSLPVKQVKAGTEKKLVTETHVQEVDRLEWKLVQ